MENFEALKIFAKAVDNNDDAAARAALENIPAEVLNERDADDYDYLMAAVQNGCACAVRALLASGKCDLTHRENLCGMTAREFAQDYPAGSPMRQAFEAVPGAHAEAGDAR